MSNIFVKYCEKQYNIMLGHPTIQLGTFQYYRDLNPTFSLLGDKDEATSEFSLSGVHDVTVTPEQLNTISGGSIRSSSRIRMIGGHDSSMNSRIVAPNCYIFCLVRCEEGQHPSLEEAKQFDKKYDSWYRITDIEGFRNRIGELLPAHVKIEHFSEKIRQMIITDLPLKEHTFGFGWMSYDVTYVDSRTTEISKNNVENLPKLKDLIQKSMFTKTKQDEHQKEYRIVFTIEHPRLGVLPVKNKPLLLTVPPNLFSGVCSAQ